MLTVAWHHAEQYTAEADGKVMSVSGMLLYKYWTIRPIVVIF